jgi:hypothetical protein
MFLEKLSTRQTFTASFWPFLTFWFPIRRKKLFLMIVHVFLDCRPYKILRFKCSLSKTLHPLLILWLLKHQLGKFP